MRYLEITGILPELVEQQKKDRAQIVVVNSRDSNEVEGLCRDSFLLFEFGCCGFLLLDAYVLNEHVIKQYSW